MKTYRFECFDEELKTQTTVEFSTGNDAWSGYDGPMWKFFEFLKGCGYVFASNDEIGVVMDQPDGTREFIGAGE